MFSVTITDYILVFCRKINTNNWKRTPKIRQKTAKFVNSATFE